MRTFAEYEFKVRSYECGPDGFASMATLCNYLQEAASMHAAELGFSRSDFAAAGENISWVLTRLRVCLNRPPKWQEKVVVRTYPRVGRRITAERDFILTANGERLGVATSEWMVIDLKTRKVAPIPQALLEKANDEDEPVLGPTPFSHLRWDCREASGALHLRARRGDIDLNGHVNNVHYVEWIAETLPEKAMPFGDFEIAFKSETLAGEEVLAESVEVEPGVWSAHVSAADGHNHVVARIRARNLV